MKNDLAQMVADQTKRIEFISVHLRKSAVSFAFLLRVSAVRF
jgi:hypothetical protein